MTIFGYRIWRPPSQKRMERDAELARLGQRLGVSRVKVALHQRGMLTHEIESVLDEVKEKAR